MATRKARCKLMVTNVEPRGDGDRITLTAQYDESLPEDQKFSTATPWADLDMQVDNPALKGFFEEGQEFYVDLIPVEADEDCGCDEPADGNEAAEDAPDAPAADLDDSGVGAVVDDGPLDASAE